MALAEETEMDTRTVAACGAVIGSADDGLYELSIWWRRNGHQRMEHSQYERLTWGELCDVLSSELDGVRPGWEVGGGWSQPPLYWEGR